MRFTLRTKAALLTTLLVLGLVSTEDWWQYQQLSGEYLALMRRQQQALTDTAAADLDYKLGTHLAFLGRAAHLADATTLSEPAAQQRLFADSGLQPMFDGVALIALDGTVIVNNPPNGKGLNFGDRAYFRQARDEGRGAISAPLMARTTNRPVVVMAVPIKAADGKVIGVLGASLALHRPNVLGNVSQAGAGDGRYSVIVTGGPAPVVVMHPDAQRLLLPADLPDKGDADAPGDLVTRARVPSTDWELRIVLPAKAAQAPLENARRAFWFQLFWLGLACVLLVWLCTAWLMRPLQKLSAAMRSARGAPDRPLRLDVRANDERGDLAREFAALMGELRDQRDQMAAVTDASPLGLFRCDLDGRMTYVNDAYLTIHGLTRDAAAEGWLSLLGADIRDAVRDDWHRLVKEPAPLNVTRHLRRPDGTEVLVFMRSRPVWSDGRVVGHVGTVSDFTERTRAERALRDSEHRLRMITDNLPVLISYLDRDLRFRFVNRTYEEWFGVEADKQIGMTVQQFYGDEAWAAIEPSMRAALAGQELSYERDMVRPTGRSRVRVTLVPDRGGDAGDIMGLFTLITDVTPFRTAERALQESEARLRTIADALPMRVAYIDAEERYRFNNLASERSFGRPREQVQGQTVREVLGEAAYRAIEPHIHRVLKGQRSTFQSERTGGDTLAFDEAQFIPQFATDGSTVLGFHAVVADITLQKLEERRLVDLARVDTLTGVVNRAGFDLRLAEAMEHSRSSGTLMALMYLDIDQFKRINDELGHHTGDALLRAFAGRLSQSMRTTDTVARLGGDEFTVIMQAVPRAEVAAAVAAKIVAAMRQAFTLDEQVVTVTTSIGLAFYQGGATTPAELLRQADRMLYDAKGAGRNNVQVNLRLIEGGRT